MMITIKKNHLYILLAVLVVGFSFIVYSQFGNAVSHSASEIYLSDGRSIEKAINPASTIQDVMKNIHPADQICLLDGRSVEMAFIPNNNSDSCMGTVFHSANEINLSDGRSIERVINFSATKYYNSLSRNLRCSLSMDSPTPPYYINSKRIDIWRPSMESEKEEVAIPQKSQIVVRIRFNLDDLYIAGWPGDEIIKFGLKIGGAYSNNCTLDKKEYNLPKLSCDNSNDQIGGFAAPISNYPYFMPSGGGQINFTISNPPAGIQNISFVAYRMSGSPPAHAVCVDGTVEFNQQNIGYPFWLT